MPILKNDQIIRNKVKGNLTSVLSYLDECDSNESLEFAKWFLEKSEMFKKHYNKERYHKLPSNMDKGDIVLVRFGINVGSELSDTKETSKGHFAMIWCQ